jgi:hypothetical protein
MAFRNMVVDLDKSPDLETENMSDLIATKVSADLTKHSAHLHAVNV